MAQLIDVERNGGRIDRWWKHWLENGNKAITIETVEDIEPLLKQNRRELNDAPKTPGLNQGMRKVASIPATVIEEVCRVKGVPVGELIAGKTDRARSIWNELVNDRNFRKFRTHPGRI